MKKRVSIYIDGEAWERLKDEAWSRKKSASAFLEEVISGIDPLGYGRVVATEILKATDRVLKPGVPITGLSPVGDEVDDDMAMLAQKQSELDAEKSKRNIKEEKIKKVRESGYFNPQPKGKK